MIQGVSVLEKKTTRELVRVREADKLILCIRCDPRRYSESWLTRASSVPLCSCATTGKVNDWLARRILGSQGGESVDRFTSCTRRGACLSWGWSYPRTESREFGAFSSKEPNTWAPTGHHILRLDLVWRNWAPGIRGRLFHEAARKNSTCGIPREHMGLMTGPGSFESKRLC